MTSHIHSHILMSILVATGLVPLAGSRALGRIFYLRVLRADTEMTEINCGATPIGLTSDRLVEANVQVVNRTRVFVQAPEESCNSVDGKVVTKLRTKPVIGVQIPDSSPSDKIRDGKIGIDPTHPANLNFQGSF